MIIFIQNNMHKMVPKKESGVDKEYMTIDWEELASWRLDYDIYEEKGGN